MHTTSYRSNRFFCRRGGVNVPNRTIEEVVTSFVCGLLPTKSSLVWWTCRPHSETTVALLWSGVLLAPWDLRVHICVRIACRKLRRHPSVFIIPFVQVPVSNFVWRVCQYHLCRRVYMFCSLQISLLQP